MEADRELTARCLAGDDEAWERLLKTYSGRVYNLCYRFTGSTSTAEELTQEIFVKIFQTLASFDPAQGPFGVWLHRVTRNHLVDHYRRTSRDRATVSLDDDAGIIHPRAAPSAGPATRVESRERRELIQAALAELSPDMREVVILRDLQDLDYAEIAQVLGLPAGTVKSRLNRGRMELGRALKRMLKGEMPE